MRLKLEKRGDDWFWGQEPVLCDGFEEVIGAPREARATLNVEDTKSVTRRLALLEKAGVQPPSPPALCQVRVRRGRVRWRWVRPGTPLLANCSGLFYKRLDTMLRRRFGLQEGQDRFLFFAWTKEGP